MNRQITPIYIQSICSIDNTTIGTFMLLQQKKQLLQGWAKSFVFTDCTQSYEFTKLWNDGDIKSQYFIDGLGSDLMIYRSKKIMVEYCASKYLLDSDKWQIITDEKGNPTHLLKIKESC